MTPQFTSAPATVSKSTGPFNISEQGQVPIEGQYLPSLRQRFPEISHLVFASGYRLRSTMLLAIILASTLGMLAIYFVPAQYLSTATVRVLQREGYLLTTQQTRAEDAAFVRAQAALVSQEQTLIHALQDDELSAHITQVNAADQVDWLRSQIKAEISVGSDAMTITASNSSADLAVRASRAVTRAYIASVTEQLRSSRDRRIHELELTGKEVDDKLMQQWRLLQSKAGKIGSGNPQSLSISEQLKLQTYRENSQLLKTLQFQRSQIELQLASERNLQPRFSESPELQIQAAISRHPEVNSLREQVLQVDVKIGEMKELIQSKDAPQLVRLQNEREYYVQAQSQAEAKIGSMERKRIDKLITDAGATLKVKGLDDQLTLIDREMTNLRETMTELESSIVETSGPTGVELEIIRHEIDREEKLADNLWKTLQELRIEERAEPRVAVLSLPVETTRISRSKQMKAGAAASLFGLLVAVLGIGFVEWSSCCIRHHDDVAIRVRIQVFGSSMVANRFWFLRQGLVQQRRGNQKSERIQGASELAAQLLLQANSDGSLPSVLVTSATDMEPRGRLTVELAEALAGCGRSVLLVACDSSDSILSQQRITDSGQGGPITDWSNQIRSSSEHGFDYLSIGDEQPSPRWIASQSLPQLLKEVKPRYDSIVVLGPAVLTNAESVLIATKVDYTVLAVVMGCSRWDLLQSARNRLQLANSKVLGALFTAPEPISENSDVVFRNSKLDQFAAAQSCQKEEAVLSEIKDLQGQMNQSDPVSSPIKALHDSIRSRRAHPSLQNRTVE